MTPAWAPKRHHTRRRVMTMALAAIVCATATFAQGNAALTDMMRAEQRFAARALVVGWKQAFLEYFADGAVAFNGDQTEPAKDQFRRQPDPPKDRRLIWEPRYGDMAASGDFGYLTGPVRRIVPGQNNGQPFHSIYASVWKRQADGSFKVVMDMGVPTPGPVMLRGRLHRGAAHRRLRRQDHARSRHQVAEGHRRRADQCRARWSNGGVSRPPRPERPLPSSGGDADRRAGCRADVARGSARICLG